MIGGYDGAGAASAAALFAPLGGDGSIGGFTATAALPFGGGGLGMVDASGWLYVAGFNSTEVDAAPLNGDGTAGAFKSVDALPYDPFGQGLVTSGGKLWVAGGMHVSGTSPNFTYSYYAGSYVGVVNASTGAVSWTAGAPLPAGRARHGLATSGATFLWTVGGLEAGGDPGTATADVEVSRLDATTGVPGPWTATTPLPSARYSVASFESNGFLFAVGGHTDTAGEVLPDVLQARIKPDGTLGPWIAGTPLPQGRYLHAAVTNLGYAYVIGGFTTDYTADIEWKKLTTPGVAAKLGFAGAVPSSGKIGECLGPFEVQLSDAADNPTWNDVDPFSVNVSTGDSTLVSLDAACAAQNTTILPIAAGADSAKFWVKFSAAGEKTIQVSRDGLTAASTSLTVDENADPHSVNGWGCSSVPAGWFMLLALLLVAKRDRRVQA